ncbi:hypothetical protein [Nocardioides psychrotolerans]|uniref:hypothetical protein n=1 Tax=Nocardioides psychrotolerans TaxID=1005945 RepID=UPI003137C2D4
MSTLADRLADLADDAPHGTGDTSGASGLWQQGRRYARRRRLETGALVVVLLLALGSVGTWVLPSASYDVAPADASASLRLPDRLFTPSPYLPGTDDVGPVGPLVAVFGAERKTWRGTASNALVGVGAAGDYAFLDLPDVAPRSLGEEDQLALSTDGRFVGYWVAGEPEGEANYFGGDPVVGIAVLDTVTGDVLRHEVPTEHGLDVGGLVFAGDRLWADYGQFTEGAPRGAGTASSTGAPPVLWDVTSDVVTEHPELVDADLSAATHAGARLVRSRERAVEVVEPSDGSAERWRLDVATEGASVVDPTGRRVAVLADLDGRGTVTSGVPKVVRAGVLGSEVPVPTQVVPGEGVAELLGWRDEQHVVGLTYRPGAYVSIDVTTGETERLVLLPSVTWSPSTVVAADALTAPTFDAPEPPSVVAPWVRLVVVSLALLVVGVALLWWRRRARV